jgi:hypothetical protein
VQHNRRTVLRGVAIGLIGASTGCLDGTGNTGERTASIAANGTTSERDGTSDHVTTDAGPSTSPTPTEPTETATRTATETSTSTPTCESGLRRLDLDFPGNFELAYSEGFDFELSADPGTVATGEGITFSLRNSTDEPLNTGSKTRYAIERRIEDGWRHVLQIPVGYTRPNDRVTHQSGDGFTWSLTASQEGFSVSPYTVCEPLQPGEYHFTYRGFPGGRRGLTIGFDLE